MTDIKTVPQKMTALMGQIAGTKKRHDSIILALGRYLGRDKTRDRLSEFLSRKLASDEGIIMSGNMYAGLVNNIPNEGEMFVLQKALESYGLSMCCIYQRVEETATAVFVIIHKDLDKALEYRDSLNSIFGNDNPQKPAADIIKTFIKLTETMEGKISLERILQACTMLDGNEVYCVTKNILEVYRIEPKQLSALLDKAGFQVCPLIQTIDPDTPEVFHEYEKLVGIMISHTEEGIEFGKEHINTLLKVCQTSEKEFLKPPVRDIKKFLN